MASLPVSAVMSEMFVWRFAGAAVWHAAAFALGTLAWSLAPPAWFLQQGVALSGMILLGLLQLGVLGATYMVVQSSEPPPIFMPLLGLHGHSWPGLLISRVLLRTRKLQDLIGTGVMLAATSVCAATSLYMLAPMQPITVRPPGSGNGPSELSFDAGYGLWLGGLYTVFHFARCRDVLAYPSVHRHRSYVLRQRLPACVWPAVRLALVAGALALAAGHRPASLRALAGAVSAASVCVWGWLAGQTALEVVMTEPVRVSKSALLAGREPVRTMLDVLGDTRPVVQELGLQDLATLCQGRTPLHVSWRSAVWADESGRAGWSPVANTLAAELRAWVAALSGALPGAAAAAAADVKTSNTRQWNVLAAGTGLTPKGGNRAMDVAAWTVRAKSHRVSCCLRALAGLAAASRVEDRFGVVLMSDPVLGDVTLLVLAVILVTQQYTKAVADGGVRSRLGRMVRHAVLWAAPPAHPSLQQVDVVSQGVEDVARGAAYQLACAFGPSLKAAVQDARSKPAFGTPVELQTLLAGLLAFKE